MSAETLYQISEHIVDGAVSAEEIATDFASKAEKFKPFNLLTNWDADQLLSAARRADADQAVGHLRGPLHGVPLIIKDNINTIDFATSAGTPALVNNIPAGNAMIVERLIAAGALIAGKANMHELSSGGTSANHVFGTVRNPYDQSRIPGGSSGGVAAAVAARLVPAGIGTDTAGSVRVPAALCGVVGFRPTIGRYSAEGIVPLSKSFDTAGPIATTVKDIQILDAVLSDEVFQKKPAILSPIRLGVAYDLVEASSAEVKDVMEKALKHLSSANVTLVPVAMESMRDIHRDASTAVIDTEFEEAINGYLGKHGHGLDLAAFVEKIASPSVRMFTQNRLALDPRPDAYSASTGKKRERLESVWHVFMKDNALDAVTFPTTPEIALRLQADDNVVRNAETLSSWLYFNHSTFASFGRRPSITIPAGLSASGLPVGLSLDGLPGQDTQLLQLAELVTNMLPSMPAPSLG